MSPAEALLGELRMRGVVLSAEHGRLRWTAPAGAMTPELTQQVRAHKPELLALLGAEEANIAWRTEAMRAKSTGRGLPRTIADQPIPADGKYCETCGEPQAHGRFPRCTYCALAAARVLDERRALAGERRAS